MSGYQAINQSVSQYIQVTPYYALTTLTNPYVIAYRMVSTTGEQQHPQGRAVLRRTGTYWLAG